MASPVTDHSLLSSATIQSSDEMLVTKRNGNQEIVSFDKILNRIKKLGQGIKVNYTALVVKVIDQLYNGISTRMIDELSAEQCASMASIHPDYNVLAGRIIVSNHHKNTIGNFSEVMTILYNNIDKHGKPSPLISDVVMNVVKTYGDELNALCDYERDYLIDYFGFKTLERAYLMRIGKKIYERPQHMWLRVSIGIHGNDIDKVKETYALMSSKYFTHATPTLFNAGTPHPQLSSCYLLSLESDSIEGIYNTLKDCALISKWAGGIGLHVHNVRASGSHIRGTNGTSNGIVPMLRVFNNTAKYVDQCVLPNATLYTLDGPIDICNCTAGKTKVLGVNGKYEVVKNVLEHQYDGPLIKLYTNATHAPLLITPEHPLYVYTPDETGKYSFNWVNAGDITSNDYLSYPSFMFPDIEEESQQTLSFDDCTVYGIIQGFGTVGQTNNYACGIKVSYGGIKHVDLFLRKYLQSRCLQFIDDAEKCVIEWPLNVNTIFRMSDFYVTTEGADSSKRWIHPRWMSQPRQNKLQMIKFMFPSLSCKLNASDTRLMQCIQYVALSIGSSITFQPDETTGTVTLNYVAMPNKVGDVIISRVLKIETVDNHVGLMYDLQMEVDHSYLLYNGLVHNGGGKRNGSFAIYLEPWHADIELFLQMRKNHGDEDMKARDLFYSLWIPDLFMERVKTDGGQWTLMCPDECPGLADAVGDDFVKLYTKYEKEGKGRKTMPARDLWFQILDAQMETGTPYLCYKDASNKKSNQQNLGVIKSSNLCTEIIEYSDENESAVCNLASIALPAFVTAQGTYDFEKLHEVTKVVTNNLNRIIDVNFYPTEKTRRSNLRHRPIGIGVQGLADVFMMMNMPFNSPEARELNRLIFETIYHGSVEKSNEIAKERYLKALESSDVSIESGSKVRICTEYWNEYETGANYLNVDASTNKVVSNVTWAGAYSTFEESPASNGILQFDMWNVVPTPGRYNWDELKESVKKYGIRNSLLLAPMPTASTSQILGYNECIEPITSNIYSRRTLAGEFIIANKYMMKDLIELGLWNEQVKNNIIANNGSIQHMDFIPEQIRNKYRTVWEMSMRGLIDMAADRGAFVCQSQSLNLWLEDPNYNTLTSMHFYGWNKGLKTGIYYLRRRGRHQAQQFTIEPEKKKTVTVEEHEEICEMCSA